MYFKYWNFGPGQLSILITHANKFCFIYLFFFQNHKAGDIWCKARIKPEIMGEPELNRPVEANSEVDTATSDESDDDGDGDIRTRIRFTSSIIRRNAIDDKFGKRKFVEKIIYFFLMEHILYKIGLDMMYEPISDDDNNNNDDDHELDSISISDALEQENLVRRTFVYDSLLTNLLNFKFLNLPHKVSSCETSHLSTNHQEELKRNLLKCHDEPFAVNDAKNSYFESPSSTSKSDERQCNDATSTKVKGKEKVKTRPIFQEDHQNERQSTAQVR